MPAWFTGKRLIVAAVAVVVMAAATVVISDRVVSRAGGGRIFTVATHLPRADVALVLGTSPRVSGIHSTTPVSTLPPTCSVRVSCVGSARESRGAISGCPSARQGTSEPSHG